MVDITNKSNTLRTAIAQAIVRTSSENTIEAIKNDTVPKGNVFAMSKAAGLLGVKKTSQLLPDCHPLPIEYTDISYEIDGLDIIVKVTVKTIYKTGVEVEAMHGASVVALNMYDMLKPIDKGIEIHHIKLLQKTGGKSDYQAWDVSGLKASIIICSDSLSAGTGEDKSGKAIEAHLKKHTMEIATSVIIPDNKEIIATTVKDFATKYDLIVLTGGTGLSPRDVTPEAIIPLLEKRILGAEETIRRFGQDRMPYAMLSRSVVGVIRKTVVISLPGSPKGVTESLDAVLPHLFHTFRILQEKKH